MAITKITTPELFNLQSNNTEGTQLPVMTRAERIAMTGLSNGELIFNSTTDSVEYYDLGATAWYKIDYKGDPLENFNTVLYTGNGSAQTLNVSTIGFQPDLVWLKQRTGSLANHLLADTVRGPWKIIYPNIIYSSDRTSVDKAITSFADGFTVKDTTQGTYECNGPNGGTHSGNGTYVAWCFKAGGAAVANTNGSINSQVSVNDTLGFSIVSYTGPALIANTVGHGLGQTPEMIILKSTSVNRNWNVFHKDVGTSKNMHLNEASIADTSEYWTASTDTFSIQDYSASADWIAYCFVSKPGFSKVGSYTGNGNSTGPVVPLGFPPAWVMIKGANEAGDWMIFDNKRSPTNPANKRIDANTSDNESTDAVMDLNSDGFQIKTASAGKNAINKTFIYLAFA